jgi:hypothetical protein
MERHSCMKRYTHRHRILVENHLGRVNISDGTLALRARSQERHRTGNAL